MSIANAARAASNAENPAAVPVPVAKPVKQKEEPEPNWEALRIRILRGCNLAPKNSNGKSDPYLKLWCGQYKYKSKKKTNTLVPEWNETAKLIPSTICTTKRIEVECWDWDLIGSDNFMGQFSIDPAIIQKLVLDQPEVFEFYLEPKPQTKKSATG